ncbi:GNAT family N-acetyltransferase [Streptomyces triticirhizae]|uniref:GNAT family N-acetyltransferase n=1 Tax=Streptomyces triticirhizae TaxID=2483353 RepID=A0A3M2LKE5_9ACTN|nr:GNAT family N-acetyltransferase [Streptomyces triticirhizae]RMI37901.1 GNAT family N-acetyltransferase [Streptomyces triticirhizae]
MTTTADLVFSTANEADIPEVVALVESAYRGEASRAGWTTEADLLDGQRTDPEGVRELIADPESLLLTALSDGRLIACCHLQRRPGTGGADGAVAAYFGMFAVRPGLQGAGVGRRVLAEAETRAARDWGAASMVMRVVSARAELIAWYERCGYRLTGERLPFPYGDERFGLPLRDDLDFAVLVKPLG